MTRLSAAWSIVVKRIACGKCVEKHLRWPYHEAVRQADL
jgi:hypothetical protein